MTELNSSQCKHMVMVVSHSELLGHVFYAFSSMYGIIRGMW